jgi:hypothetical protein
MPRLIPIRLAAACALALLLFISTTAVASAKKVEAGLRVVAKGKVLAEETLKTGTTNIPTSRKADCFGKGTGGSGKPARIAGPTALGLLGQAATSTRSLRPLLITDAFDFGLGICGVGNSVVSGKASWYLKVNHKAAQVGGELVKLHAGDDVLWDLAPSYPYPNELALVAPATATVGVPFGVRVFSYDEKGKRSPVYRAGVSGATEPTDSAGRTMVTLSSPGLAQLTAKHGKDIPAPAVPICLGSECAASPTG